MICFESKKLGKVAMYSGFSVWIPGMVAIILDSYVTRYVSKSCELPTKSLWAFIDVSHPLTNSLKDIPMHTYTDIQLVIRTSISAGKHPLINWNACYLVSAIMM